MINQRAIRDYLDQPRDNLLWVKKLTEEQLDQEIAELEYTPIIPLMKHQKAAFLAGVIYPTLCLWLSMGVGKSAISLELLRFFYQKKFIQGKTLIFAPTDEVVQNWENEIAKWKIDLPFTTLLGSTEEKWDRYNIDHGLVIGTYVGMAYMVSTLQPAKKKEKNELVLDPSKLPRFLDGVQALVMDESTKIANHKNLSFKVCNAISKNCTVRYALAGRPFGRDPLQLWAQFFLVDRGETLAPHIGFYQEVFFHKKKLIWHPNAYEHVFNPKMQGQLTRITAHRSLSYDVEECVTLPELTRIRRYVDFPAETVVYYNNLVKDLIEAKGDVRVVKNVFLRMRTLSSGFVGMKDDDTGERSELEFASNPKLDLLMELIEEIPPGRKCIVFYDFTWSGRKISEELKKRKIKAGWLWAGTKNWAVMEKQFREDPKFKALVINSKKGAYGLNLQHANYVFFYESPVSGIDRDQAEKRAHRTGQKHTVFLYDLLVRGSVDEKILAYQSEGRSLFQALVSDPAKVLKDASRNAV